MDGHATRLQEGGSGSDSEDWALLQQRQQQQAQDQSLIQSRYQTQMQKQNQNHIQNHGSTPLDLNLNRDTMERPSATNLRSAFRVNANPGSIGRAVTPDLLEGRGAPTSAAMLDANMAHVSRGFNPQQGSPRSVPVAITRRQGIVFNDAVSGDQPSETSEPLQTQPPPRHATPTPIRPRTRTLDATMLGQRGPASGNEIRHRVGSVSSSGSQPMPVDDQRAAPVPGSEAVSYSSISSVRMPDVSTPSSSKDKKSAKNRHALKRQPSRPPAISPSPYPSIDSLPYPMPTEDTSRLISLMKTLGGRMRGELEYQGEYEGPWHTGMAYIDEDKCALMFDTGPTGPFHIPLVSDLRGCKVHLMGYPNAEKECIEIVPPQAGLEVLLCPLISEELELWLAALLCWQQLPPVGVKSPSGKPSSPGAVAVRPEPKRQGNSSEEMKPSNVIKIGSFMLWDKGPAASARAVIHRSSTRDLQNPSMSWRRVSFALQDNGEFRLLVENSKSVLSVIELPNLSRCAIQALDRTVLDEEYCIAIFPIYATTATHLSIFRPVYLALESRTDFEVWFVLLRTFAVPDLYQLDDPLKDEVLDVSDMDKETVGEFFRMEKIIRVRVTEAKIKTKPAGLESLFLERNEKMDRKMEHDPLVGNYLAEVILDGEVRARTMTKMDTNNPYWRVDCEFNDLPPTVQELSVVLKRVEIIPDVHSKLGLPQEIVCGTVIVTLNQLERGQAHEDWQPILDERQQVIGSMLLRICHEEHVALLSKEYEPLSEILQRMPASLTTQITAALSGQLRPLSEIFLNIFQCSGTASEWLMALVEDEIDGIGSQTSMKKYRFSNRLKSNESVDSPTERELMVRDISKSLAGEANLLFRGNTLLTQSLEFHMRRLGKEYLEEVLRDKITEINELNPDCEVDRTKLQHGGADLDHHWNRLIHLTTEIWECIVDSAERIPTELRHILKYIRAVAEDRYGDFLRTANYTSVSGFLFLRFICPAILSPKLFGLLRDHPKQKAQRTLTLIAKALQKLSNVSTFGKREEYMEPMNRFLTAQRTVFKNFIDKVCGIPANQGYKTLPPSYSTPVMILNRLGPTAREGFPSLPYLIDHAGSFSGLVKLWVDNHPLDGKRVQAEPDLVEFNDLCFDLQKRADACLAKFVEARSKEASNKSTDQLAEATEHVSLTGAPSSPFSNGASPRAKDRELAPGSSGSECTEDLIKAGKDSRRGRDGSDGRKGSGVRHISGTSSGTFKTKNGRMGRTILNGIMRIGGGRAESPDSKT
ncbi:Inhibitory regulator BUD2/CLA2-like protein [Cladobotryum mycophilum]|uniref:Inhibitory regulator BUD2/CLA2-like protein n=1 Tax=Cladobotryum mycophilum TaxID=491253 RepID=A0ABR0SJ87_9HYPO